MDSFFSINVPISSILTKKYWEKISTFIETRNRTVALFLGQQTYWQELVRSRVHLNCSDRCSMSNTKYQQKVWLNYQLSELISADNSLFVRPGWRLTFFYTHRVEICRYADIPFKSIQFEDPQPCADLLRWNVYKGIEYKIYQFFKSNVSLYHRSDLETTDLFWTWSLHWAIDVVFNTFQLLPIFSLMRRCTVVLSYQISF